MTGGGLFVFVDYFTTFTNILAIIFDLSYVGNVSWWIFIVLSFSISSHMELSSADIKGALIGFGYLAVLLLIFDFAVCWLAPEALYAITGSMSSFAIAIVCFLGISAVFSLAMVILALLLKGVVRIFKR